VASRETELAGLWRALIVNEAATQRVFDAATEGMTPDQMQEIFVAECRRRGIDGRVSGAAFVVGEGGAGPKLRTKQPLRPGDLFGMDFQFASDGFYSDIGRYAVFGPPSADLTARHSHLLEMQQRIADAVRPGEPIRRAFEQCPPGWTIEAHRVGTDIHMDPMFSTVKTDNKLDVVVEVGMVMCVEIWKGFDGGIEDQYLVTERGLDRLTTLPRQLIDARTRP
jgi:Xaa-Pro aminopeptidase